MKNNIINNEFEEFEERNIPIKVPSISSNKIIYKNNIENIIPSEVNTNDYTDELNKSKEYKINL